jgi:glycosyltransferase involved in cell wall biosynthesis
VRLLLVTHRPVTGAGGSVARWRALVPRLRDAGWTIDVISAGGDSPAPEFDPAGAGRVRRRARVMRVLRRVLDPAFRVLGITPAALPSSMAWLPCGVREIRARTGSQHYDVVVATGPPMVALLALRLAGGRARSVFELRDLWAGNPAYDRGGKLLGRLETWLFRQAAAIVVATPEAQRDVERRHPGLRDRVVEISNGFEPELLALREPVVRQEDSPVTIMHSGTLLPSRPLGPLLTALGRPTQRGRFRLVLHGYLSPETLGELAAADPSVSVDVIPPSDWEDAIERMRAADVCLVTQSRAAGDATAVAAKAYEYLALGKPVLCLTDGGATEGLLRRLGSAELCARLDDPGSIESALDRAAFDRAAPVAAERLQQYSRDTQARAMNELLRRLGSPPGRHGDEVGR